MAEPRERSGGWIGAVLDDRWRIDAKIARGGVATVYRATHREGQTAAIKIMHPELARNEEVRKRFLREGYAANKVGHPQVVSIIHDDETSDGNAYIVMELLENGETLEDRRERLGGKLPVPEAVDICAQILDVLAVAHEKGIIHRDIKPENIFVLEDGTVKVLDFGIAHIKEAAKATEATATGLLLGTPEYMSPEQVLGKRGQIDAATDIYAVGATLFTLVSGESVHVADTLNMLLVQAASRQARSLASVAFKDLPKSLIAVVDKALALEKPRRWPSARAMQLALREIAPAKTSIARAPANAKLKGTSLEGSTLAATHLDTAKPEAASLEAKTLKTTNLKATEVDPPTKPRPPPARPASLPPPARPASLPPPGPLPKPARPSLKAQPVRGTELLDGPVPVATLTTQQKPASPARTDSVPPPSLPPISGPTTVIPRGAEASDPWTDDMGADDLDGPTVATVGGPSGGAPAPSVRSEVLARSPMSARSSAAPSPPSYAPDSDESTQLIRTDERMALANDHTVNLGGSGASPALSRSGSNPSFVPAPPPRDAAGRSIAPPAVPPPQAFSAPPPPPAQWMPQRMSTMPMQNDPRQLVAGPRPPLPPLVMVAIGVAGLLIAGMWIATCAIIQSN